MTVKEMKIYEPEYIVEKDFPLSVVWEEVIDKPASLAELSPTDGGRLDTAETDIANIDVNLSDIAIQGWQFDGAWSAIDNDTVAWGAGTLRFKDGQTFSIAGGNTGDVAALTYIYFDKSASLTVLQKTTVAANAVGQNKLLMAVMQNVASGKKATFQAFGGKGGVGVLLTADNIAANSITANEIQTNTITSLSLTSGSITGLLFRTAVSGLRIEMDTTNVNMIRFYDATTLFAKLEAYKIGSDGYVGLIAQDDGAGFEIYTGVGASAYSSSQIYSIGGGFSTSGNASNGFNTIDGKYGGYFGVEGSGGAGPDYIITDLKIDADWIPTENGLYDLGGPSNYWYSAFIKALTVSDLIETGMSASFYYRNVLQPLEYFGYVNSNATMGVQTGIFSVSSGGTGLYTVTHNFGTTAYVVNITVKASTTREVVVTDRGSNSFSVRIYNNSGATLTNEDFMFIINKQT